MKINSSGLAFRRNLSKMIFIRVWLAISIVEPFGFSEAVRGLSLAYKWSIGQRELEGFIKHNKHAFRVLRMFRRGKVVATTLL